MLNIILAILIFGLLIFIHECGHFFFARLFNVTVYEFAVGMGPKLLSKTSEKSGITYSLRLLPFGGFVSMAGEDEESDDENAFSKKPVWQRFIITAAGAFVNLTVGVLVMMIIVICQKNLPSTQIGDFIKAETFVSTSEQGLAVGDEIVEVDGAKVFTGYDVSYEIMRRGIKPIDLTVVRNGEKITVEDVTFPIITEEGTNFGALDFKLFREEKTFLTTAKHALARSYSSIKMVYDSLYDLITGRYGVESMSGPVGVTEALGEAAESGGTDFIYLAAFLSINLGVMNLLPLPALDGGRLVFQLIEMIFRRPVPVKVEGVVHFIGLAILMLLLVVITFKDIIKLIA